jgi:hypothetical protein
MPQLREWLNYPLKGKNAAALHYIITIHDTGHISDLEIEDGTDSDKANA